MTSMNVERISGVVVGYDGSETGLRALDWAVGEALARRVRLTVVHVWEIFIGAPIAMPMVDLRAMAEETLGGGLDHVRKVAPELEMHSLLERGSPAARLIELSRSAEVIVIGSRGRGGFAGLLLGSVGAQLSAHAACPVVVVRGETELAPEGEQGRVVVGVDGSAASRAAVEMAFAEAEAHRVPLAAVVAWLPPPEIALPPLVDADGVREVAEARLARMVMPLRERYPAVRVETRMVAGVPQEVLLDAAAGARLLVVGTRGLGGVGGVLLGSVSQALLHHAPCPVAVVPAPARTSDA